MEGKRKIAVFDFDGTLTTKDTLLEFIKFACGRKKYYIGFLLFFPVLVLMKTGLYPSGKAKEKFFSFYFKGMKYDIFLQLGSEFAQIISTFTNNKTISILQKHVLEKADIYVVTASIEEWVRPYCERLNVKNVIGTKIEVVNGYLTGRFVSKNCYGKEKVSRMIDIEPDRSSYYLYAYGDSYGDKALLEYADEGYLI